MLVRDCHGDMGLRFGANNTIQKQSTRLAEQIITKRVGNVSS